MKRATVLLLALLVVPAARADAKFSSARVCGPSDCREVAITATAGHTLGTMMEAAFSKRSRLSSKPPEASPWYRVTLCAGSCDSRHALTLKLLPTAGYQYIAEHTARRGWTKLDEHPADGYRSVTGGLEPFPASRLLALGATEPSPMPGEDPGSRGASGQGGIPTWAWIAIAVAAAASALPSLRRLQRSRRSPSVR